MNRVMTFGRSGLLALGALALLLSVPASATIDGLAGGTYAFTAREGYISTADGGSYYCWGYANGGGTMQFPGPTLIVNEGQVVTITLTNAIPHALGAKVSIVFPGQEGVTATGGTAGLLTQEASFGGGAVTYTFTASHPGTYLYHSGTSPELQCEMGLNGAIIVRPAGHPTWAYNHAGTAFDHEYMFLLTDMDPRIHELMELNLFPKTSAPTKDSTSWWPTFWFINGRTGPDTMADPFVAWLPNQPYNCSPRTRPGEKVLIRFLGAGHDSHPLHTHGENHRVIARDGRLLESTPGAGPDLGWSDFTATISPGETMDALWSWTGYGMGWDIYGHQLGGTNLPGHGFDAHEMYAQSTLSGGISASDTTITVPVGEGARFPDAFRAILYQAGAPDPDTGTTPEVVMVAKAGADTFSISRGKENTTALAWASGSILAYTDHGRGLTVSLPSQQTITNGQFVSGSPFLGGSGELPPGEGGFNLNGGLFFMWHSHNEREIVNDNTFPGGMLTMAVVEPPWVVIP